MLLETLSKRICGNRTQYQKRLIKYKYNFSFLTKHFFTLYGRRHQLKEIILFDWYVCIKSQWILLRLRWVKCLLYYKITENCREDVLQLLRYSMRNDPILYLENEWFDTFNHGSILSVLFHKNTPPKGMLKTLIIVQSIVSSILHWCLWTGYVLLKYDYNLLQKQFQCLSSEVQCKL